MSASIPYEIWDQSKEHLPKVTAEMQVSDALRRLIEHCDADSLETGVDDFINWVNENLKKKDITLTDDEVSILENSGNEVDTVRHKATYIIGRRHIDYESPNRNSKHPDFISARDNLQSNLKTFLSYARVLAPEGLTRELIESRLGLPISRK